MARDILLLMGLIMVGSTAPLIASDRTYDFEGFTGVALQGGVEVDIVKGNEFAVAAEFSRPSLRRNLDIRMRGDTLVIDRESGWSLFMLGMVDRYHVTVQMPVLDHAHAAAGSDVWVDTEYGGDLALKVSSGADLHVENVTAERVDIRASSGGDIEVDGTCGTLNAQASSGGQIEAADMRCANATAQASSGADIDLFATETAGGRASSGGQIDIRGTAVLTDISESSGGDVDRRG